MPSKIEETWARLHGERKSLVIPNAEQKIRPATVSTEMPQTNRPVPIIKHYDISTDEYHHYHVAISEETDEIIRKECSVSEDDNPCDHRSCAENRLTSFRRITLTVQRAWRHPVAAEVPT